MTGGYDPRCPSRIAHEDGAVRRCLLGVGHNPSEHWAGGATWDDDDDRVLVGHLDHASAALVERGDRLDVVTTDGDRLECVVTSDPQIREDGTVTFDAADAERHAAMERLSALTQWPDQPSSADTAVEQLEVHHARGRERTDAEEVAVSRREQLTGVEPGRSLGEQPHPAEHCDLDGQPHLGPCVEPGTRTAETFRDDDERPEATR